MSDHLKTFVNHAWSFLDAIVLVVIGISLVEIHMYLSIVAVVIASIYNGLKLIDYLITRKLLKKQKEDENKNPII